MFSFSSGASPARNAGRYYHHAFSNSQQIFLTKEPNKHDARRISAYHMSLQVLLDAMLQKSMLINVTFIAMLIKLVTRSLSLRK